MIAGNLGSKLMDNAVLIEQCKNGDKKSFEQLISANRGIMEATVFRFIKDRDSMEEVIQEVMIRIFKGLPSFNGKCKLSTWISRIAFNESMRLLEKESNRAKAPIDCIENLPSNNVCALEGLVLKERKKIMKEYIDELPVEYQETVKLHYFEDMKLEDIALKLNLPKGTVFSRIGRARDILKDRMKAFA